MQGGRVGDCLLFPGGEQACVQHKHFQRGDLPGTITSPECHRRHDQCASSSSLPSNTSGLKFGSKRAPCSTATRTAYTWHQHRANIALERHKSQRETRLESFHDNPLLLATSQNHRIALVAKDL